MDDRINTNIVWYDENVKTPYVLELEERIRVLKRGLIVLANLDGIVFASDSQERPMLAQSVVRHIANAALMPAPEETGEANQDPSPGGHND